MSWKCHVSGAFCILNYMYIHVYYIWGYLSLWMLSVYLSLLVILNIHFHCSYDFITFVMSVVLCLHGLLQLNNLLKFLLFERHSIHFQQINYKIYLKLNFVDASIFSLSKKTIFFIHVLSFCRGWKFVSEGYEYHVNWTTNNSNDRVRERHPKDFSSWISHDLSWR